jgi:hypothetical protein
MNEGAEAVEDFFQRGREVMKVNRRGKDQDIRGKNFRAYIRPVITAQGASFQDVTAQAPAAVFQVELFGPELFSAGAGFPRAAKKLAHEMAGVSFSAGAAV